MEHHVFPSTDLGCAGESGMEIMGVTHKGKEEIAINDNHGRMADFKGKTKLVVREGSFRLMDLPAELRIYVYSFLLPYNVVISHRRSTRRPRKYGGPWIVEATTRKSRDPVPIAIGNQFWTTAYNRSRSGIQPPKEKYLQVQTQLFLINKEIANEARAVLYGSNTYEFSIKGSGNFPLSLPSPEIFGPFGDRNGSHLPLLRNMRIIHIEFLLNADDHWAFKRQRARLEHFVDVLKQHPHDEDRKSLLQELKIHVQMPSQTRSYYPCYNGTLTLYAPKDSERFMFALESLVALRNIKDVQVTGVPNWYAQCLQLCVQGKGGEALPTDWPLVKVKRTTVTARWTKKTKNSWVTARKWYQPTLNWKEFAERNSIFVPADIDKYWIVER